ncbi:unnamed protein product, partial [Chrysoparadoxa australica]
PRLAVTGLSVGGIGPADFDIAAGACLGLTGPSGAGKTRLLRAVADLEPHEGECRLYGRSASAMPGPAWRRSVSFVAAESGWWDARVGAHIEMVGDADLDKFGFAPAVRDWSVERLSAGERQRLALLRHLAAGPLVLLLDEPVSHLDADLIEAVIARLAACRQDGMAVIWVDHDGDRLGRVADRIARLDSTGRFSCS